MAIESVFVTPVYAAICGLIFVGLSVRTLMLRRREGVAVGDGNDPVLSRAIRAHGNFSEYVPLSLILLFFLESAGEAAGWIHLLGSLLVAGRLSHAYGVSRVNENFVYRVTGMALTFTVIVSASLRILVSLLANA